LIKSFTRRTSGHCLGTFQTAKLCFDYTPLQNGSVSHYPPQTFFSLSLSRSLRVPDFCKGIAAPVLMEVRTGLWIELKGGRMKQMRFWMRFWTYTYRSYSTRQYAACYKCMNSKEECRTLKTKWHSHFLRTDCEIGPKKLVWASQLEGRANKCWTTRKGNGKVVWQTERAK
jgi:hypothetical protein